jgi:predicted Rossmann fold flavoprotein
MAQKYDVIILGAGASGLLCAMTAGRRGRRVLILDHAQKIGEKVRISGGGRCNFTNLHAGPKHYFSNNPRFCRDALKAYPPREFMALMEQHRISWHEKEQGQLFCDNSAMDIVEMLRAECAVAGVEFRMGSTIRDIDSSTTGFIVMTNCEPVQGDSIVVATGGRSIPKMGATGFGYDIARRFGLCLIPQRPGLVPLTFDSATLKPIRALSGLSLNVQVRCAGQRFDDALLFTHRGLSGPAILRASNYWQKGESLEIDLAPGQDLYARLKSLRDQHPRQEPATVLAEIMPKRLARHLATTCGASARLAEIGNPLLRQLGEAVHRWRIKPQGTEGWRTAEVTLGGVDTQELDSRTLAVKSIPGLYFIGEVVDVTGDLGGFNLHWAWASGHAAGLDV